MFSRILLCTVGLAVALSASAEAATQVTVTDGTLLVTGDAAADKIAFSGSRAALEVRANGQRSVVGRARVNRVVVRTGAGADRVDLGSLVGLPATDVDLGADTALDELAIAGTAGKDELTVTGGTITGLGVPVNLVADARDRLALATLDGPDQIDWRNAPATGARLQVDGGLGDDLLIGGPGNDVALGGDGLDAIFMGRGDDVALGGRGDDVLRGDFGDDVLDGGLDTDILFGDPGDDVLLNGEVNFD